MSGSSRLWVAVMAAALMAGASWFGGWAQPTVRMADVQKREPLASVFPRQMGDWRIDELSINIELPPDVAAQVAAIYTEVADKVYINSKGDRIMVTIAYGRDQSDGFKVHRPEVCYAAQGFHVDATQDSVIKLDDHAIDVKRVMTHLGERHEPVTYWMVIGDDVVNSPARHKVMQVRYALDGLIADGLLVRVSSISRDPDAAYVVQDAFVREWKSHVPASQRARLFGG